MRKSSNNGGPHIAQHSSYPKVNLLFKWEEIWSLSAIKESGLLNVSQPKGHWQYKPFVEDTTDWYGLENVSPLWQYLCQVLIYYPQLDSPYYSTWGAIIIWIINNTLLCTCMAPKRFFLINQIKIKRKGWFPFYLVSTVVYSNGLQIL